MTTLDERGRVERERTWRAIETNALLSGVEIVLQRLRLDGAAVQAYLNIGRLQGVRPEQQFEIVALPDLERYGVLTVTDDVTDEYCWCELDQIDGRHGFVDQMRERLKQGEVQPPRGFEVRPYMAGAYARVVESLVAQAQTRLAAADLTEESNE